MGNEDDVDERIEDLEPGSDETEDVKGGWTIKGAPTTGDPSDLTGVRGDPIGIRGPDMGKAGVRDDWGFRDPGGP